MSFEICGISDCASQMYIEERDSSNSFPQHSFHAHLHTQRESNQPFLRNLAIKRDMQHASDQSC